MNVSRHLPFALVLAALSVPAALAQEVAPPAAPAPAAAAFRFELHWKGPGAISLAGRNGCSWSSFAFTCAEPACVVVIGSGGVTTGDDPAKPGAAVRLKLTNPASAPLMTCLVGDCSWAIEHADGSVHSAALRKDGTRKLDELGDMDVLIEP